MPLGPTGYGDSPYQSFSTFAGNPYFIDLVKLIEEGLLKKSECDACDFGKSAVSIDYEKIYNSRFKLLEKVLQFAFDSREDSDYLPHNYTRNSVVYTGTHDNDTTAGWFKSLNKVDKIMALDYMNIKSLDTDKEIAHAFARLAMASVSDLCVIPMQDYLGLDGSARINMPSTLGGNWEWRMKKGAFTKKLAAEILDMTKLYARYNKNN